MISKFNRFIFSEKLILAIIAYCGHLQALKVHDLKLFMSESIVRFKRPKNQSWI